MMGHSISFHIFSAITSVMSISIKQRGSVRRQADDVMAACSRLPQIVMLYVGQCLCIEKAAASKYPLQLPEVM